MTHGACFRTVVAVAAAALLLALPSVMRAQTLSAPGFTNASSANESSGSSANPSFQRLSSTSTLSTNGTSFQTRYFGNASADCGPACGSRTETLGSNYTVSWTVGTASNLNIYRLQIDTRRTAGLTIGDDGSDGAQATMGALSCTASGTVVSGGCTLTDPADNTSGGSSDVNVNQTNSLVVCGQALSAQNHTANFTWSQTAFSPSTGFVQVNMDEAAVRLGANNLDASNGAANYPGTGGRTQANDGHFVTVTMTNLCGNGTVDTCGAASEQCDQGALNGTAGSCCNSNCTFKSAGSSCSDNLFCNGADTCNASGSCVNHVGDPCLVNVGDADSDCSESCDEGSDSCTANDPNSSNCLINGAGECSNADTCLSGVCQPNNLASGTPCTDSSPPASGNCRDAQCNGGGVCDQNFANEANGTSCNDSTFCNGTDQCNGGTCSTHSGDPCLVNVGDSDADCSESCNEASDDCTATDPNASACSDGLFCNGTDSCTGGNCSTHTGDPCLINVGDADNDCSESCNESADNCTSDDPNGSSCSDGLFCDGTETCDTGTCGDSTGDPCDGADDDNDCSETCDESADDCDGNDPDGSSCDNGFFCDGTETCDTGTCGDSTGDPCPGPDNDNDCSESCNEAADNCAANDTNGAPCNNGLFCDGTETCTTGTCGSSTGDPCPGPDNDNNCAESCDETADDCNANDTNGSACNNGLFCDGTETCTTGTCGSSTGDPCPGPDGDSDCSEECNEASDDCSANDANGSACDDGMFCDGTETCTTGTCGSSTGDPCPGADGDNDCSESCDESADNCLGSDPNGSACEDNLFCNGTDTCSTGACSAHTGDPCAANVGDPDADCSESCNETADDCTATDPDGSSCTDSLFCNGTDTCDTGTCSTHTGDPCVGPDGDTNCSESCDEAGDDCDAADPDGSTCRVAVTDCDATETCSGGACPADGFQDPGTACGSPTNTDCSNPDTCDGAGSCDVNNEVSGTACGSPSDTDCTNPDTCDGLGTCEVNDETAGTTCGSPSDTDCSNPDTCNGSGTCNPNNETDGTTCGSPSDTDCDNPDACLTGACDANNEDAGEPCGDPSDTECDNPDACDGAGGCGPNPATAGTACTPDSETCTADECDGSGTCDHPAGNAGVECRGTTTGATCDEAEECDGVNPTCPADGVKDLGESCRAAADDCDAEETCDGVTANCPADDVEDSGTPCRPAAGDCDVEEECDGASAACPVDGFEPDGTACNDGQFCSAVDACDGGVCEGSGSPCGTESCDEGTDTCFTGSCPALPSDCRTAAKTQLLIKNKEDNTKDKLLFKWIKGQPTSQNDLTNPLDTASYALCIYSNADGLIGSAEVPPSGSLWFEVGTKGYKYLDNSGGADGVTRILVKGSPDPKSKALVKGKGNDLPDFALPFVPADLPITAQLRNNQTGVCFGGEFANAKKNTEGLFKAKNP